MVFAGIQKITLIDYPGKIAAVVFTSGCSFRCPWCYSPELVLPEKIKSHPKISEKYILDFLTARKELLDGVVVCGGEPCLQKDLPEFIEKVKKIEYFVKLDTNGSNPAMLKDLIGKKLVNYVAMDIKVPFGQKTSAFAKATAGKQKYDKAVGIKVDLNKIKKSIEMIKNSGIDYEFRTTVVPGIHKKEDILQIARDLSPAKKYYLQNFMPEKTLDPEFKKIKPYPQEYLLEIQKAIAPFFEICQVR